MSTKNKRDVLDFKIYTEIHDNCDMSSPAKFIISYIKNGCRETYMNKGLTEFQCRAGFHRSFSDLYRLASGHFETVDRLQLLYDLIASYELDCFICKDINKLVFNYCYAKGYSENYVEVISPIAKYIMDEGANSTYNNYYKNIRMSKDKYLTKKELKDTFKKVYKDLNEINAIEESVAFSTDSGDEYVRITF